MKNLYKQLTNFGKVLTASAFLYACAPKNGNSNEPIINIPNEKPAVVEEFRIKTPLSEVIVYNKARNQIARPENTLLSNPLYQTITNHQTNLTTTQSLEDRVLREKTTQKPVGNLEEMKEKENSYVLRNLNFKDFVAANYIIQLKGNDGKLYDVSLEVIEKDDRTIKKEQGFRVGTRATTPPSLVFNK